MFELFYIIDLIKIFQTNFVRLKIIMQTIKQFIQVILSKSKQLLVNVIQGSARRHTCRYTKRTPILRSFPSYAAAGEHWAL